MQDPALPRAPETGLIYSCTVGGTDNCQGVRGDTSRYISPLAEANGVVNGVQDLPRGSLDFFLPNISEGRLFDQARELFNLNTYNS